jgi:hypothetical protein
MQTFSESYQVERCPLTGEWYLRESLDGVHESAASFIYAFRSLAMDKKLSDRQRIQLFAAIMQQCPEDRAEEVDSGENCERYMCFTVSEASELCEYIGKNGSQSAREGVALMGEELHRILAESVDDYLDAVAEDEGA